MSNSANLMSNGIRYINEFRCYEAKIEESEKAGSIITSVEIVTVHINFTMS